MKNIQHSNPDIDTKKLPAILGGNPVFEISEDTPFPKLEQWKQITESEAQIAYEMTLRNELSGSSATVQEFERVWRERHQTQFAMSLSNGTARIA